MEKYPIYKTEILKSETNISNCDEFIELLKEKVKHNPIAAYISTFDHFAHTRYLIEGDIDEWMNAAKVISFCFGMEISDPILLSVRPRNIWIAEYEDKFIVSFLDSPREKANKWMKDWIEEVSK